MTTTQEPANHQQAADLRTQAHRALNGRHHKHGWGISDGVEQAAHLAALATATDISRIAAAAETLAANTPSAWNTPWPEGVTTRYLTLTGATVDLTGSGDHTHYHCTGCDESTFNGHAEYYARDRAQAHAEKCRALPRPS